MDDDRACFASDLEPLPRGRRVAAIAGGLVLAGAGIARAEPASPPLPPAPVSTTPTLAPTPTPPPASDAGARFAWEPFGFLRLQYKLVQNDPNIEFVGRDDGFELQNARVGARGRLGDRVRFVISFDGAVDERAQINVPEGKLGVGLRDAYADVMMPNTPALFVRAGLFRSWVDPQSQIPDTERPFVDRPIESLGIRATEGFQTQGLTPGRSLGAAARYEPVPGTDGPGAELAVQNGADEFASNNDNDKPAISIAGLYRFGESHVVVGGRYNPRTVGDLPFRQDETDVEGSAGVGIATGPIAIGAAVVGIHTTFPTTGGPARNAFGAHGQLLFRTTLGVLPMAIGYRFGILDPSSLFVTDRVMEHTVGAVLAMPRYRMRVQAQVTHVIEQESRALSNDRVQVAAEVSL